MIRKAALSNDKKYRYILTRIWDKSKPLVLFVGFNPSTADHIVDDATVKKLIRMVKSWERYGGFKIVNLFAIRSKEPSTVYHQYKYNKAVGYKNDEAIKQVIRIDQCPVDLIILCWGSSAVKGEWGRIRTYEVIKLIRTLTKATKTLFCFGQTKFGQPRHPLYLKDNTPLRIFNDTKFNNYFKNRKY